MQSLSSTLIFSITAALLLVSLPTPAYSVTHCYPQDKAVLLQIKAALNNPYHLASWDPTTDCCTWYDVKCANKSPYRIIQLTIFDDTAVTGQIPAAVGNLPFLQMLDLNHLNLTGPIPSSIGNLSNLTFLRLSNNALTGAIPASLTNLKNLSFLDVSHNQLCGPIPQGGQLQSQGASAYANNKCLCGAPLASC